MRHKSVQRQNKATVNHVLYIRPNTGLKLTVLWENIPTGHKEPHVIDKANYTRLHRPGNEPHAMD